MTTAREIMSPDAVWVEADVSVADAARRLREQGIGALPICDGDGHLQGMVTDRDIAVKVVADGRDPSQTAVGDLAARGEVVTIGADDPVEEAIRAMKDHDVRRLPVIDGDRLVGMVSQADIARELPDSKVGDLVAAISIASPNN
ncbi:MAG TPA: CBS domain-containing protein [Microthrixaceae bacterium]|nr:CBS domain-containing protein [Microthrixaceae bacterium]